MNVLIVYSSKWGVSRTCAEMLAKRLEGFADVGVYDINDAPPSPEGFDVCVVGGSIRMAAINKRLKRYIKEHASALSSTNTAFFLCCGFCESFDDYVSALIPKTAKANLGVHCFGGELKPEKLRGIDKLIVRIIRSERSAVDPDEPDKQRGALPEIIPEHINILADRIRALL